MIEALIAALKAAQVETATQIVGQLLDPAMTAYMRGRYRGLEDALDEIKRIQDAADTQQTQQ